MRKGLLILSFALIAASCGGAAQGDATTSPTAGEDTPLASTTAPQPAVASGTTETGNPGAAAATPAPTFDGPPAPDFELALADGSTFRLSEEQKPVFLIFWAEW